MPIPVVVVYRRVIVRGVTIRVSVIVVGVPPIGKTKGNKVETEKETAMMTKERVGPVVIKESAISEPPESNRQSRKCQ